MVNSPVLVLWRMYVTTPGLSCSSSGVRASGVGLDEDAIADELHFRHGAVSAVTYLVQALPMINVRIQSREEHTVKVSGVGVMIVRT